MMGAEVYVGSELRLEKVRIRGFKSLRDVTLTFGPGLTLMIGANNSGKSNALGALELLRDSVRKGNFFQALTQKGRASSIITKGTNGIVFDLTASLAGATVEYSVGHDLGAGNNRREQIAVTGPSEPSANLQLLEGRDLTLGDMSFPRPAVGELLATAAEHLGSRNPSIRTLWEVLRTVGVFDFSAARLRTESVPVADERLAQDGSNLAATLDVLYGSKPDAFAELEAEVVRAAPEVRRVRTAIGGAPGSKVVSMQQGDGSPFLAADLSDGLLLFTAVATAAAEAGGRNGVIALEEPDRGIHPRRMREMLDMLRKVTRTGTQVLITSHSPLVLDEFKDHPEHVLIFERVNDETTVTPLSERAVELELKPNEPLGDIWYSGLIGGVPRP